MNHQNPLPQLGGVILVREGEEGREREWRKDQDREERVFLSFITDEELGKLALERYTKVKVSSSLPCHLKCMIIFSFFLGGSA